MNARALKYLVTFLFASFVVAADVEHYEYRGDHDPNGIGKFYLGREIAQVMGPGGILWLERSTRDQEEQTTAMLDALQLNGGETVADFGAGSGYFTFELAKRVGARGTVVAVDIEPKMLAFIRQRAAREGLTNVGLIQSTERDPRLPAKRFDLILMVDVYHELSYPYETLQQLRLALKPKGRLALVEYRQEDPNVPIKELHKMSMEQMKLEMAAVGLEEVGSFDGLPQQHLVFFGRP